MAPSRRTSIEYLVAKRGPWFFAITSQLCSFSSSLLKRLGEGKAEAIHPDAFITITSL
jgi:hypothetical protein